MKRLIPSAILLALLIVYPSVVKSQEKNYTLYSNESGSSKSYTARDSISLIPGFSYMATPNSTFSAKIDPTFVYPPTDNIYAKSDGTITTNPEEGGVVGSIPMQFNVSPGGAATYNIPIECLEGINGMQPQISLDYNSQLGDGPLGVGWNISGLSSVICIPKNVYSNNAVTGWDFSTIAQQYALDGNVLFAISGDYGGDGTGYYTQNKTYDKINSHGSLMNLSTRVAPEYFEITTKEGKILEYRQQVRAGSNTNNAPYQWLISKITDANGNYMTFHYENYGRLQTVLREIKYGSNINSTEGNYSILFNYDTKTSSAIREYYIAGEKMEDALLLNSVDIRFKDPYDIITRVKKYSLIYDLDDSKYFLQKIALTGNNGDQLCPTKFSWGENPINPTVQESSIQEITGDQFITIKEQRYSSGDVDGDGIADMIQVYNYEQIEGGFRYYRCGIKVSKNGIGNNGNDIIFSLVLDCPEAYFDKDSYAYNGGTMLGNFNNDQKKAVLVPYFKKDILQYGFQEINCDGSSTIYGDYLTVSSTMPAYTIGDFNNDGLDEIIFLEKKLTGGTLKGKILYTKKADPTKELLPSEIISYDFTISSPGNVKEIIPSDYNNDGLLDILLVTVTNAQVCLNTGGSKESDGIIHFSFTPSSSFSTTEFNSNYSTIKPGDFNGDGLTDFIVNGHSTTIWKLVLNTGSCFSSSTISNINVKNEDLTFRSNEIDIDDDKDMCIVVDLNHDGKSDVVIADAFFSYHDNIFEDPWGEYEYSSVKWYFSNGTGFNIEKENIIEDEHYFFNAYQTVGDFNGDGYEEIFSFDSNLYSGKDASDGGRIYYYNTNNDADKLIGIVDGMGNSQQINYQYLTNVTDRFGSRSFYTVDTESSYPIADLQIPLSCVNRVIKPNGLGGTSIDEYSYEGLKAHINRGLLGFTSLSSANSLADRIQKTTSTYDDVCYLPSYQLSEERLKSSDDLLTKTESWSTNSKTGNVFISQPLKTIQTDRLTGIESTTDNFIFDSWGNQTQVRKTKDALGVDAQEEIVTTIYGQFGNWSWCVNKPTCVSSTTTLGEESITRTNGYDYNSLGNLITEKSDTTDVNKVVTTYSDFNVFGNPLTIQTSSNGNTRTASVTYSPSGRFLKTKTNALSETTTYVWDEICGILNSSTTRLGTTYYSYDGFGRRILTTYPDGKKKTNVLRWSTLGNAFGSKYYSYEELSGSAPVYIWFDSFGREKVKETYGLNKNMIRVFSEYQTDGKLYRTSEPTFNPTAEAWATRFTYYPDGRMNGVVTPSGTATYEYSNLTTIITSPSDTTVKKNYANGLLKSTEQNGKRVDFTYYPSGLVKTSTPQGGVALSMEYNLQGNRTKLIDPDAGTIETVYNGFGELVSEKQNMHNNVEIETTNIYDPTTGLIQNIIRNGETTSYSYDIKHRISSIEIPGKHKQEYFYDDFDRVIQETETIGNKTFTSKTEYDQLGRERKHFYPSCYFTQNFHDVYGNLIEVKDGSGRSLYKPLEENARGQLTKIDRGEKESIFGYDNRGLLTSIYADSIIDYKYSFKADGNLDFRIDSLHDKKEKFRYDEINRLTNWDVYDGINSITPVKQNSHAYDQDGNISKRTGLENFEMEYGVSGRPHALDIIKRKPDAIPYNQLDVTYTDFKKIASLSEGNQYYTLQYGVDDQRRKSVYQVGGVTKITRYYQGGYEEEVDANGNIRKIHYLCGGAVLIRSNGKDSLLYGYSDNQGSLIALTNESGTVIENYAYDPWGLRRNPEDWSQADTRTYWLLNRGYTGHEHLDAFAIINMNGRVFDPVTGIFFSPDPQLQEPENWLNYNRYGYCLNNPLKYTDPTGEAFGVDDAIIILAMAYYGGLQANAISCANSGHNPFNPGNWNWNSPSTYIGITSGALSGIGMAGYSTLAIFPKVDGIITRGTMQAVINVGVNGLSNTAIKKPFLENWEGSALSGFVSGAITGYQMADANQSNYWWGTEVKNGRTSWSFFTSAKPYLSLKYNLINGSRDDFSNECGVSTIYELDYAKKGGKGFDDCATAVGYMKDQGSKFKDVENVLVNNYGAKRLEDGSLILNADYMKDVSGSNDLITVYADHLDPKSQLGHWDNIRQIDFYSTKIVVRFRIGSYKINNEFISNKLLLFYRTHL